METEKKKHGRPRKQKFFETTGMSYEGAINYALDKEVQADLDKSLAHKSEAQGKYTGRKPIPTDWMRFGQLYGEWRAKNITGRDFMRRMDMSANTFYRRVREYELRHGITEQSSS